MSDGEAPEDGERAAKEEKGAEVAAKRLSKEELGSFSKSVAGMSVEEIMERKAGDREFARAAEQLAGERLGSIELTEEREYIKDGERVEYYARRMRASEMFKAGLIGREVLDRLKEDYGLEDAGFTVYSRRRNNEGKLGERAAKSNIYSFLHGWTGNRSLYEIESDNGLSPIENILDLDPDGIVVTLDGNGFGETIFDEALQGGDLKNKCTAHDYACQENYIVSEILGLGACKENIVQAGHSMGGAAVFWKTVDYGYKGLALAPALLASGENRRHVREREVQQEVKATLDEIGAHNGGVHPSARLVYAVLAVSTQVGDRVSKLAPPLEQAVEWTTKKVFERISTYLLGVASTVRRVNERIVNSLKGVHQGELIAEKLGVTGASIHNLRETDLSQLTPKQIRRVRNLVIVPGPKDALVPYSDLNDTLVTLACLALEARPKEADSQKRGREVVTDAAEAACALLWATHQRFLSAKSDETEGTGHYAPVFSRNTPRRIVELARRGRG